MHLDDATEQRLQAIENAINDLTKVIKSLSSLAQLRQITSITERSVGALSNRVASLESQVLLLQDTIND